MPRHLRFDVPERTLADGTIEQEVDVDHVARLARELAEAGIEAVAISFLHSFTNPRNEQRAAEAVRAAAPELRVSISSEVVPEIREFERTSTTIANVYVQRVVERYLADLEQRLARLGFRGSLHIMLSNGGIAVPEMAARFPVRLLESGPAGGALAAAAFGSAGEMGDLISFDMGGTTAKLCVIEDGEPLIAQEFEVDRVYRLKRGSGLPVRIAVVDMIEIGAGGGSIARVDALGLVTVGPDSSGSDPGPACYGLGGREPTVTDADLVLGYLDPSSFLGGRMHLDVAAAREAIERRIAGPIGVSVEEAAFGIHDLVNEGMTNAARVHAVERGKDPASLPLFAFGGAGPVHACGVARALGVPSLVGPPAAGVLSAIGFLTAPLAFDFVRSVRARLEDLTWDDVDVRFAEMEAEGLGLLRESGVAAEAVSHRRFADLRYEGQGYEIRVPVPDAREDYPGALLASFDEVYLSLYERPGPHVPVEAVNWRVVSSGPRPEFALSRAPEGADGQHAQGPAPRLVPRGRGVRRHGRARPLRAAARDARRRSRDRRGARVDVRDPARRALRRLGRRQPRRGVRPMTRLTPFTIQVISNRIGSILNEQQTALVRTAFSTVVRESEDLACGVFNQAGLMVAQSLTGTPGHVNSMATGVKHFVHAFPPESLEPGDVLITNDPWKTAGQVNDFTVVTPVFRGGRPIAYFASTCHAPDIGGRQFSGEAREVYEEGIQIPMLKILRAGEPNRDVIEIIRTNVRQPDETIGDIYAQISSNEVGADRLRSLLDEFDLPDVEEIADEIISRSERAMRAGIAALPDGTYTNEAWTDGFDEPIVLRCTVTVAGDEMTVDWSGSSPQSPFGINLVLNYTHAYASYAMKAAVAPEVPHNDGAFRPVHVTAPLGSILNCEHPAPVASRHVIGHFLPGIIFGALADAVPGRLLAGSADALWITVWQGRDRRRRPFVQTVFQLGGMGARTGKDGLSATGFPSGVAGMPAEVVESLSPLVFRRRELTPDTGGAGRFRGGLGQDRVITCSTDERVVGVRPARPHEASGSRPRGRPCRSRRVLPPARRRRSADQARRAAATGGRGRAAAPRRRRLRAAGNARPRRGARGRRRGLRLDRRGPRALRGGDPLRRIR